MYIQLEIENEVLYLLAGFVSSVERLNMPSP